MSIKVKFNSQSTTGKKFSTNLNNSRQLTRYKKENCLFSNENNALKELDDLIGLSDVKLLIKELMAYVLVQKARDKEKLLNEPMVLHMIFKGNALTTPVKHFLK